MKKKFYAFFIFLVLSFQSTFAQHTSYDFGADVVSRYLWRGSIFGGENSPHIQPWGSLSVDFEQAGALSLGFWASYGLNNNYAENDLSINYTNTNPAGTFSLTLFDYYYPYLDGDFGRFTNFKDKGNGAHTLELNFIYTAPEYPIYIMASSNIKNDPEDEESLYFEIGCPFSIGETDLTVFSGVANGISSWHGVTTDKFEFINIGFSASKAVKITEDYSLPLGMSWVYNPHQKKTFLVFKLSF